MISSVLAVLNNEQERNELAELYAAYSNRFYAIAYSKVHNRQDSEEAVIEAFSRIAAKPENFFRIPAHKRVSYVDVIVRNIAVDMFKHKNNIETVSIDDQTQIAFSDISIEEMVIGEMLKDDLIDFIRKMPVAKKDAITLRIVYQHSTAEIAEILGISETAARKRLSDAGKMIKEFIEKGSNNG